MGSWYNIIATTQIASRSRVCMDECGNPPVPPTAESPETLFIFHPNSYTSKKMRWDKCMQGCKNSAALQNALQDASEEKEDEVPYIPHDQAEKVPVPTSDSSKIGNTGLSMPVKIGIGAGVLVLGFVVVKMLSGKKKKSE